MPEEQQFPRESFTILYPEQIVWPSGPVQRRLAALVPHVRARGRRERETGRYLSQRPISQKFKLKSTRDAHIARYGNIALTHTVNILYEADTRSPNRSKGLTFHYNSLPKFLEVYVIGLR